MFGKMLKIQSELDDLKEEISSYFYFLVSLVIGIFALPVAKAVIKLMFTEAIRRVGEKFEQLTGRRAPWQPKSAASPRQTTTPGTEAWIIFIPPLETAN